MLSCNWERNENETQKSNCESLTMEGMAFLNVGGDAQGRRIDYYDKEDSNYLAVSAMKKRLYVHGSFSVVASVMSCSRKRMKIFSKLTFGTKPSSENWILLIATRFQQSKR